MTLRQFSETLSSDNASSVTVIVMEDTTEIITFKASGYGSLEDELEQRQVDEWLIAGPLTVKVYLKTTTEP